MTRHQFLILAIFSFLFISCNDHKTVTIAGPALGTSYQIKYFSETEMDIQARIDEVIDRVNQSMSTYIPDSKISRINKGDTTVVIDDAFREVLNHSYRIWVKTNGYFDPTVGALVNAWGFGPEKGLKKMDSARVDSIMQFTGFGKITTTSDGRIQKADPRVYLDFNAIAKGYTVDLMARMLDSLNIENYLVEIGGEVIAKGINLEKNTDWVVAIDNPRQEIERTYAATLRLKDRAMASSGNYRKFRIDPMTGEKYVHTIDPKTGYTKKSNLLAVSVIAKTCMEADAYATAFMAMELGLVKSFVTIDKSLEVFVVYLDENGEEKIFMTHNFNEMLME